MAARKTKREVDAHRGRTLAGAQRNDAQTTCDSILHALISVQGKEWSYQDIADAAGCSKTSARRYLKPEVWETMTADELLAHRDRAGAMGVRARDTSRFLRSYYCQLLPEAVPLGRTDDGVLHYRVNTSRFGFLRDAGRRFGWTVVYDARAERAYAWRGTDAAERAFA